MIKSPVPVLSLNPDKDFFATWCQPCKFIAPIFLDLSKKYTDLKFGKVDVDAIQDAKVSMVPTFKFYENGKELEKKVTGMNLENLKLCVEKFHNGELS